MKRIVMVAFIISIVNKIHAQVNESIFSFNYGMAPVGQDDIDFYSTDFNISIPVKFKKSQITNSVSLDINKFNYTKDFNFSTEDLSNFYSINYGIKYTYPITNNWIVSAKAQVSISSNLVNTVTTDDLLLTGEALVTKTIGATENNETITLGVNYATITGKPSLLPTISYTNQFNDKFSVGIGYPKTYANYKINDISSLQSTFLVDGFYANLSNSMSLDTTSNVEKASFTSTTLALEYNYKMDENWGISFKGGYALSNKYTLLNNNDETTFNFNTNSKPFLSAGITFNLKNKQ